MNAGEALYANDVADPETIDLTWSLATGAPLGPFRILDIVGLETAYNIVCMDPAAKDPETTPGKIAKRLKEKIDAGCKVGIICTDESRSRYPQGEVRSIGARKSQESVAHNLYALLREFDDLKVDYIFSESFTQDHLGQAIMNRLSKAAGYQIYKV